jgi:hypothetical protein
VTARSLLAKLASLGVLAEARGDQLALRPASVISSAVIAEVLAHKVELLALLAAPDVSASEATPPPPLAVEGHPFPSLGARCGRGSQWWWVRVDRLGREAGAWHCGICNWPTPGGRPADPRERRWRWTWSGASGALIEPRPDRASAVRDGRP